MNTLLGKLVAGIEVGSKQAHENMTVFPLVSAGQASDSFLTLDDALDKNKLKITEVNEAGSVPNLKAVNLSSRKIMLLNGEEIVGAKQNRVLNATILLAAKSETIIPVSCVEHGRWSYRSGQFTSESRSMSAEMRRNLNEGVTRNFECGRDFHSDQGEVWESIERKYSKLDVRHSPTMAMSDLHESVKQGLEDYLKDFSPVQNQIGIVVLIDRQVAGMEIINRFDSFALNYRKLVASYALDAVETLGKTVPVASKSQRSMVSALLESLSGAESILRRSVGLGSDMRLKSKKVAGSGLELHEEVLQLTVFPFLKSASVSLRTDLRRASVRRESNSRGRKSS